MIFFKSGGWDGPLTLHQMLDFNGIPDSLRESIPDYKMILISPESLKEEDLKKMSTSAGYVLGAIKYSANGKELKSYLERTKDAL